VAIDAGGFVRHENRHARNTRILAIDDASSNLGRVLLRECPSIQAETAREDE
jgi:hypothetical protein